MAKKKKRKLKKSVKLLLFLCIIVIGLIYLNTTTKDTDNITSNNDIKENKEKFSFTDKEIEFICHVISSHMGPWNTNNYSNVVLPKPESKFQRFVHMCDYLASRKFLDVKFDNNNNIEE